MLSVNNNISNSSHSQVMLQNKFFLYKKIRQFLCFPKRIEIYFDLLQHSLSETFTQSLSEKSIKSIKQKQSFNTEFICGFLTLSKQQKQQFILSNIAALFLKYHVTNDQIQQEKKIIDKEQILQFIKKKNQQYNRILIQQIYQTKQCKILTQSTTIFTVPVWQKCNIKIQTNKKIINLHYNYTNCIDLRMYLIRRSKKRENTIVLESVSNKTMKGMKKISLWFKDNGVYEKMYKMIGGIVVMHRNTQLVLQYKKLSQQTNRPINIITLKPTHSHQISPISMIQQISGIQLSVRPLIFLTQTNINQFLIFKKTIHKYLQQIQSSYYPIYKRNDYVIYKSSNDGGFYKLECVVNMGKKQVREVVLARLGGESRNNDNNNNINNSNNSNNINNINNSNNNSNNINKNNNNKYRYLTRCQILQKFSSKYQAVYQQYKINNRRFQQIIIKQQTPQYSQKYQKPSLSSSYTSISSSQILLIKHIDSIINKSFMQFTSINLFKYGDNGTKLVIYGCYNPLLINGMVNLIMLLEEYVNMITGQQPVHVKEFMNGTLIGSQRFININNNNSNNSNNNNNNNNSNNNNRDNQCYNFNNANNISKDQYYTIIQENSVDVFNQLEAINNNNNNYYGDDDGLPVPLNQNQHQDKQFIKKNIMNLPQQQHSNTPTKPSQPILSLSTLKPTDQKLCLQQRYIFHLHQTTPLKKSSLKVKIQTSNWLQLQWKRTKGGGLVCKNQKVIQQQRKVYKKLLVSFGQQIIKTKGILNLSLPVIIFKKQSQLMSMAKTFKMVPYYMQKAVNQTDKLERFKYCMCTMISINSLNLSFQKPFNPILGQTLQLFINGCPLYIQQISHHPPITSYLFIGRGYRLYGSAAIKIDIGLNNAKGYSQLAHTIEFQQSLQKIQYIYPKLCIGGLLLGDRTFNFQGKTYMYDINNNIYADILFGQSKKTFFASEDYPEDMVSGKIFKVNEIFKQYYNQNKPKIQFTIDKKYIIQQLCSISGIWNQSLKIQNKSYTCFIGGNSDPVYQLEDNQFVLISDSRYRDDLKWLIKGDIDKAQDKKVQLEEIQRKDRKLRTEYKDKKH